MRNAVVLTGCLMMIGCTSMLLGGGSSRDSSPTTATSKTAASADDAEITSSIVEAIDADTTLNRFGLKVRTVDRNVIISGTVGSYTAKDRVVELASEFDGLESVSYRISVDTRL